MTQEAGSLVRSGSDLTSCVVGAIAALKGAAHGGATFAARTMLDKIGSADNAEKWLTEAHGRHERFSGFGHRVYRTYDPLDMLANTIGVALGWVAAMLIRILRHG